MRFSLGLILFIALFVAVSAKSKKSAVKKAVIKVAKPQVQYTVRKSSKKKKVKKAVIKLAKKKLKKAVVKKLTKKKKKKPIIAPVSSSRSAACVSTEWVRKRGLEGETFGTPQIAKVLCFPGGNIPCGTPGHLLRNVQDSTLISYQEACEHHRVDCIESSMLVSELSHSFDWSQFTTDDRLELTSVSANPSASASSLSRFVAVAADLLIRYGMGDFCNSIMQFLRARESLLVFALELSNRK